MREAQVVYGGISENYAKIRSFDRDCVDISKNKAQEISPDEALKKVEHHSIEFFPDIIHNLIQEEFIGTEEWKIFELAGFGRKTGTAEWDNLKLAELMTILMDKYSRDIESLATVRFVIDE